MQLGVGAARDGCSWGKVQLGVGAARGGVDHCRVHRFSDQV